jgi:hypothetical protein
MKSDTNRYNSHSILLETDHVRREQAHRNFHANSDNELGILNALRRQQEQGLLSYTGRWPRRPSIGSGHVRDMVPARTHPARRLTAAFREGLVQKYYTGISRHKPSAKKQGGGSGRYGAGTPEVATADP